MKEQLWKITYEVHGNELIWSYPGWRETAERQLLAAHNAMARECETRGICEHLNAMWNKEHGASMLVNDDYMKYMADGINALVLVDMNRRSTDILKYEMDPKECNIIGRIKNYPDCWIAFYMTPAN